MKVEISDKMIISILRGWIKRTIASEGHEVVSFTWTNGKLTVELKESESVDEEE